MSGAGAGIGSGKCDAVTVSRVRQYLADNVDKAYVDVAHIAASLKDKYKEYNSKSEAVFYASVEAAYKVVLHSYGMDDESSSNSDNGSDDLELLEDSSDVNDQLLNMYKTQNKKNEISKKPSEKPGEPIDILSSDDESEETPKVQLSEKDDSSPEANIVIGKKRKGEEDQNESGYSDTYSVKRKRMNPSDGNVVRRKLLNTHSNVDENMISKVSFEDVGGVASIMEQICDLIMHMRHPEVYRQLGIKTPTGALLHGPPGTGKTLLAHAIAGKLNVPLLAVTATELVGGVSGESEKNIRDLFDKAVALESCVLFIDEIDSICGNRINAQKDMEKRIVAQLLSSLDSLSDKDANVLVLAASNNPDTLDPALRRAGRLEQEIALGIPNLAARKDILRIICNGLNLDEKVDLNVLAQYTPGFVGADLQALMNKSCTVAIKRCFKLLKASLANSLDLAVSSIVDNIDDVVENKEPDQVDDKIIENGEVNKDVENTETDNVSANESVEITTKDDIDGEIIQLPNNDKPNVQTQSDSPNFLDEVNPFTKDQLSKMSITQEDILQALKTTKPCAIREGFATVPDITWDDVGSLSDVRRDLQLTVLAPVKYPEQLESLGLTIPSGVLLCGPPGCGKTLLAKAVANEAGINFISVKGPELLNMYVGESERAVRTCFQRARNSAPCVIFFDEFDSLCPRRTNNDTGGASRVVNQLLTEMDGVQGREGVFVLAATNRPDIIDPAVLRPGRLDRILYVGMPLLRDRVDILNAITKKGTKPTFAPDVDLETIAIATEGYTGADLAGLVRLAATQSLTDFITASVMGSAPTGPLLVSAAHFQKALQKMRPSVSQKEQQHYEKLRAKYSSQGGEEKIDVEMDTTESMDTV